MIVKTGGSSASKFFFSFDVSSIDTDASFSSLSEVVDFWKVARFSSLFALVPYPISFEAPTF